jgi:hypothetical protein
MLYHAEFCFCNFILIYSFFSYAVRPPLWYIGKSRWQQIERSRFNSQRYQIFLDLVGLERDPFGLVSTNEELLGRKSSCYGL